MNRVLVFLHAERPEAAATAKELAVTLTGEGIEVVLPVEDAAVAGLDELGTDDLLAVAPDLVIAIGGDGTMLRAAGIVGRSGPILGVNAGHLGYLTEVEPATALDAVRRVQHGDFRREQRLRLRGEVPGVEPFDALNEVVVEKAGLGHTIRVSVSFDDDHFTTYEADGLIVATPTGSTAYNLSARGPIVDPEVAAMILTPVSPHMLFDRSMVISPAVQLRLELQGHRPAVVSADGRRIAELDPGQALDVGAATAVELVRFGPRDFHRILKTKFQLPER